MKIEGSRILITGITGSWGHELVNQLLPLNPKQIIGYSRGEFAQVTMQRKYNNSKLKFIIGDVRDYEALNDACSGVDIIFHLSAIKHVPVAELQPDEAIKTNIIGTQNLIKAAINCGVSKVIDISTDKSCSPNTLYGATKLIGERLILNANKWGLTKFRCLRAGNVLGSQGSCVPLFKEQLSKYNKIELTDANMTRFFMSLPEAIKLVLVACNYSVGDMFVMRMPSCKIKDLAEVILERQVQESARHLFKIEEVGSRPGEKLHELLLNEHESLKSYEYDGNYYVVSNIPLDTPKVSFKEYGSNTQPLMSKQEIHKMLDEAGL